jgi:hypothetical protein
LSIGIGARWWTKAALVVTVGVAMVVLAQTLSDHGTFIVLADR